MTRHIRILCQVLMLSCLLPALVAAQFSTDRVGVYFDQDFTLNNAGNLDVPHTVTAYLVLHDPSEYAGGIGGWECRFDFHPYAPPVQWHLAGNGYNFETLPEFVVGTTEPLPVTGPGVLLATFDMYIATTDPFEIRLLPITQHPSIPDHMAYIPWEDKEPLTPMTTTTGIEAVASYNSGEPICSTVHRVAFSRVGVGESETLYAGIINDGGGLMRIDPFVTPGSVFRLESPGQYPLTLRARETHSVGVVFEPDDVVFYDGALDIDNSSYCGGVRLLGWGREPGGPYRIEPWYGLDFGGVHLGQTGIDSARVWNDGALPLVIDVGAECGDFRVVGGPAAIAAGDSTVVVLAFTPTTAGIASCEILLGPQFDFYSVTGYGDPTPVTDVVGIYFDEDLEIPWEKDVRVGTPFDGYLVLKQPSLAADLSGWELQVLTNELLELNGFQIAGGGVNLAVAPEFVVDLPTPLPVADGTLLATLTFVPTFMFETTTISLVPVAEPTLAGEMACFAAPGHDPRVIHPSGVGSVVAWVSMWDGTVGIGEPTEEPEVPAARSEARLLPNVPNPFNPETTIHFEVAREGRVRIDVFDVMGRRVASLLDEVRGPGTWQVAWQGRDDRGRTMPSGVYYIRLETKERIDTRKATLLK